MHVTQRLRELINQHIEQQDSKTFPTSNEAFDTSIYELVRDVVEEGYVVSSGHLKFEIYKLYEDETLPLISKRGLNHKISRVSPTTNELLSQIAYTSLQEALKQYSTQQVLPVQDKYDETKDYDIAFNKVNYQKTIKKARANHQTILYLPNSLEQQNAPIHAYLSPRTDVSMKIVNPRVRKPRVETDITFYFDNEIL